MPEGWTAANGTIQQPAVSSCPAPASAISAGSNAAAGAAGAWTSPASSMLLWLPCPCLACLTCSGHGITAGIRTLLQASLASLCYQLLGRLETAQHISLLRTVGPSQRFLLTGGCSATALWPPLHSSLSCGVQQDCSCSCSLASLHCRWWRCSWVEVTTTQQLSPQQHAALQHIVQPGLPALQVTVLLPSCS